MTGRPERARTNVRPARRAQSRATKSHAISVTGTIVVITLFLAALLVRTTGSGAALIGPWDPPAVSAPTRGLADAGPPTSQGAPRRGSDRRSAKGSTSAPATPIAPIPSPSASETTRPLPACG